MHRKTDSLGEPFHFHMDRFALQNGEWFYMTREFSERGPFDSKEEAIRDLKAYLRYRHTVEKYGTRTGSLA
jgi:hypothetical protein